jgi:hypothetical protein
MRTARSIVIFSGILLVVQSVFTACVSQIRDPVGKISQVRGKIFLGREGLSRPRLLSLHESIYPDDVLVTEGASEASLLLDNLRLTLGPDSRLSIGRSTWYLLTVALEHGTVRAIAESADALFQPPLEVRLDGGTVVKARSDALLWSQEQRAGQRPHAAGSIASFGVANLGHVGSIQLHVEGHTLPIMPQQFSIGVPGHFPMPAVPLTAATSEFMAMIHHRSPESGKSHLNKPSRVARRPAGGRCHRQEGKTGVVKTPRRDGYEDLAKCLGRSGLSQGAVTGRTRQVSPLDEGP